jgi:hypothetical protein
MGVALVAGLAMGACAGDGDGSATTTAPTVPATTPPTTSVPTPPTTAGTATSTSEPATSTTVPLPVQPAVWPAAGVVFESPDAVATDFVEKVLGRGLLLGEFMAGDAHSGEIEVLSPGDGGGTPSLRGRLLLRQLGATGGWFVIGASDQAVSITEPASGATVPPGPLTVRGRARGFEAAIHVHAFVAGDATAMLDSEIARGGVSAPEPFETVLDLSGAPYGATVVVLVRADTGQESDPGPFTVLPLVIADTYGITVDIPRGDIVTDPQDLLAVHSDGDLWLHPGILGDDPGEPVRLADLGDPREPVTEGPGPNVVEQVAATFEGAVLYSDCCEPTSGNLIAATGPDSERLVFGIGFSPAVDPSGTRLAAQNGYSLSVISLSGGTGIGRPWNQDGQTINGWDLIWTADGSAVVLLFFDDDGFALQRYDPLSLHPLDGPARLGMEFGDLAQGLRFAGRGPGGELALVIPDGSGASTLHYFDGATLTERPALGERLPDGATAARLAPDGVGRLWVQDEELFHEQAGGAPRRLLTGVTAAWFVPS